MPSSVIAVETGIQGAKFASAGVPSPGSKTSGRQATKDASEASLSFPPWIPATRPRLRGRRFHGHKLHVNDVEAVEAASPVSGA